MSKKRILFIRHGKTEWNEQSRFQGMTDIPLDDDGRKQARLVSARLKSWEPHAIFSSPLSRARETAAEIAAAHEALALVLLDGLAEMGFGEWEGRTIRDVLAKEEDVFREWRRSPFEAPPPGGEVYQSVELRVRAALDRIMSAEGERVVAVSHGGIIRAALALLFDISPAATWRMKIGNCSVTAIDMDNRGISLAFLNDCIHTELPEEEAGGLNFPV
ncbi:MAG: histidine phosphatase family protein [Aminivibrio sp.]